MHDELMDGWRLGSRIHPGKDNEALSSCLETLALVFVEAEVSMIDGMTNDVVPMNIESQRR